MGWVGAMHGLLRVWGVDGVGGRKLVKTAGTALVILGHEQVMSKLARKVTGSLHGQALIKLYMHRYTFQTQQASRMGKWTNLWVIHGVVEVESGRVNSQPATPGHPSMFDKENQEVTPRFKV